MIYAGIDIGGTKCSVSIGAPRDGGIEIIAKRISAQTGEPGSCLLNMKRDLALILSENGYKNSDIKSIGICCGSPLDSEKGIVMSPPNLPMWKNVRVTDFFSDAFGAPSFLENDANACAVAEYLFGAGKGKSNIVFMTFGTGLGAGIIINGRLYSGFTDTAGEVGHVRLAGNGPVGYNKAGSAEGFCSGGGIAQLAEKAGLGKISAKEVFELARKGDKKARGIVRLTGKKLGDVCSVLIDILNPEAIIIGGIYLRVSDMLEKYVKRQACREALGCAYEKCVICPAKLYENTGDTAAIALAVMKGGDQK